MAERAGAADAVPEPDIDLSNPAASGGGEGESLVGRNKADRDAVRRVRRGSAMPAGASATQQQVQGAFEPGIPSPAVLDEPDEPAVPATAASVSPAPTHTLAKPPVRKLAKDLGVDLSTLTGTGPNGVVTRDDVHAVSAGGSHRLEACRRRRDRRTEHLPARDRRA